jgi:hypothetical protein
MKLQMFGTVGRATVPAETGRHGGRPYDSVRPKFLFRFDWTLAASGGAHMKQRQIGTANRRVSSKKFRMMKYGIASGFAFGYDPTGRSVFFKIDRSTQKLTTGRIHYSMFDVGRSMFDVQNFYRSCQTKLHMNCRVTITIVET